MSNDVSVTVSVTPHGGCGLINRIVPEGDIDSFTQKANGLKSYTISDGDLSAFYRIADGTLSPLEGPMGKDEFLRVLEDEVVERNGKSFAWTIPIVFPVAKEQSESFEVGETIAVRDERGVVVGTLDISDIYHFDKAHYHKAVYGTERQDHPGPRIHNNDPRDYLLGGKIHALPEIKHSVFGKYMLSPKQCREMLAEKKWERSLAFQTRNPLHRAHEYAMVHALEELTKQGHFAGAALNPLVGETKSDDVPADVRMKTYEVLIGEKLLGSGDIDDAFWEAKPYDLIDHVVLVGLDMRMFYAGPKEAIMHAIYRQNFGFTDIVIGRKHADAPFDDGTAAWGDFDAQEKFDGLDGRLITKPFKVGFAAYFEELGKVRLKSEHKGKGYTEISISGKQLRKKLENEEPVDERLMRAPVAEILRESYQHNVAALRANIKSQNIVWESYDLSREEREKRSGHKAATIWLTGLSGSGKSAIAREIQSLLFSKGCNVYILDGDNVRHGLNRDLGFSPEDREENIRRIGEVAKLFTEAGFMVITAFISPYRKDRDKVRSLFTQGDFVEVYVKAPLSVCEERDPKGLYKKARKNEIKEFTGISAPYEEPEKAELIINTDGETKEESAQRLLAHLTERNYL